MLKAQDYRPADHYHANSELRHVLDLIRNGLFSRGDTELFRPLVEGLLTMDPYLVLADYSLYATCQARVSRAYRDPDQWSRMSILNTGRSGRFSSDRTIREYCGEIWKVEPVPIRTRTDR